MHARRPHMVLIAIEVVWPFIIGAQKRGAQSTNPCPSNLSPEKVEDGGGIAFGFGRKLPIHDNLTHVETIAF